MWVGHCHDPAQNFQLLTCTFVLHSGSFPFSLYCASTPAMHLLLVILYRHEEGELHDVEKYLWSLCLVCIFVVFYFIFFSAAFPWFSDLDYIALICEFCLLLLGDTLTLDSLPRLLIANNARISPRIIVTVYSMSALPFLAFCQAISGYIVVYASSLYISPLYSSATLQSLICDFSLGTICTRNLQAVTI